ncbi:MAG: hypothetical protein ACRAVC_05040 [Trichormus sp.]
MPHAPCPMTAVAHGGNPQDRTASPMPHAQFPISKVKFASQDKKNLLSGGVSLWSV